MVENQRQNVTVAIDDVSFSEGCSLASGKNTYFSGNCSFSLLFALIRRETQRKESHMVLKDFLNSMFLHVFSFL